MTQPVIITVAITGALPRKSDNPAVPVTPEEQIESTHEAFEAGASLAHIHVRNADQSPGSDPELFLVEDYDVFIRASRQFRFAHIGEPLYYFRRDDATLYHSRFADVKASDFLVRFKNGLLDEAGVVTAMATLLLRHPAALRANWLRWLHRAADGRSWRLTRWQQELASRHLHDRLWPPVHRVLVDYREGRSSFGAARDALRAQMQSLGTVAPDGA